MLKRGVVALLACVGAASAQPVGAPQPPPSFDKLPAIGASSGRSGDDAGAAALAMVGREDRIGAPYVPAPQCVLADADPVDVVAKAAADAQIVIINEAHDSPRDRAFIADVAVRLAALGYKTYAAETLMRSSSPDAGAPRLREGVYSDEPVFGQLLRTLRRNGYRFVAYEDTTSAQPSDNYVADINRRETVQASNLINRIFQQDLETKVLIHVGYAHNKENIDLAESNLLRSRTITWMARRLKDILNIDPLTIDQTTYEAERDGVCFSTQDGAPPGADRDIYVAHPPTQFERNRPTWRHTGAVQFVDVPARLRRADARVIVEARLAADPADAVPLDRVMIDPGESIPLLLAPGAYKARAWVGDAWTPDVALSVRAPTPPAVTRKKQKTSRRKKR